MLPEHPTVYNFSGKLRFAPLTKRWRMKGTLGHGFTAEPQAPQRRLKSQGETHSTAWYTHCHPSVSAWERAVLHHTFVGEMYSMIAHCVCEREQESESYTVSSALKSVAAEWDPKTENCVLSWLGHRLHQSRLKALCLCVYWLVCPDTLWDLFFHQLHMLCGSTLWLLFLDIFLECHFCILRGCFCPWPRTQKKWVIMPNVLCASVLIIIMRPSMFMSLMCAVV